MKRSRVSCLAVLLAMTAFPAVPAYADLNLVARGLARTVFSVFEIPKDMLVSSPQAFPFGLLVGAVRGTTKAVAGTVMGAADIARGAAPYAKYAIFAL